MIAIDLNIIMFERYLIFLNYLNILWLPTNCGHPLTEVCGVLRIGVQKVNGDINVVLSQANQHHQACSTKQKVTTTNPKDHFRSYLTEVHLLLLESLNLI